MTASIATPRATLSIATSGLLTIALLAFIWQLADGRDRKSVV